MHQIGFWVPATSFVDVLPMFLADIAVTLKMENAVCAETLKNFNKQCNWNPKNWYDTTDNQLFQYQQQCHLLHTPTTALLSFHVHHNPTTY
jgi:hypothetical protein